MTYNYPKIIKWLLATIAILLLLVWVVKWADQTISTEIDKAVQEFWEYDCSIDGKSVTLSQMMYALIIQEWWYKLGTAWYRTNNRWSLHSALVKKPIKTIHNDWSKSWPVYASVSDGLVDKAHLITTSKLYNDCNIWHRQLFNYVLGPKADPNKQIQRGSRYITQSEKISIMLNNLYRNAISYSDIPKELIRPTKRCTQVTTIGKDEYIQIDNKRGAFKQRVKDLRIWDKVFKCKDL